MTNYFNKEQEETIFSFIKKIVVNESASIQDFIVKQNANLQAKTDRTITQIYEELATINGKISTITNENVEYRAQNSKIENLTYKMSEMNDLITQIDIKLRNTSKDLIDACYKYDKIYLDNLILPGLIGNGCKYKNVKEFLDFSIGQFGQFDLFKEKFNINFKTYKDKLEVLIESFKHQIKTFSQAHNDVINSKLADVKKQTIEIVSELREKFPGLQIENSNIYLDLKKQSMLFIKEKEHLVHLQEEIKSSMNEHVNQIKISNIDTLNKIGDYKLEFAKMKQNFLELAEFIKDVRFRKNINSEEISRNHIKKLVNNLTQDKQKLSMEQAEQIHSLKVDKVIDKIILGNAKHNPGNNHPQRALSAQNVNISFPTYGNLFLAKKNYGSVTPHSNKAHVSFSNYYNNLAPSVSEFKVGLNNSVISSNLLLDKIYETERERDEGKESYTPSSYHNTPNGIHIKRKSFEHDVRTESRLKLALPSITITHHSIKRVKSNCVNSNLNPFKKEDSTKELENILKMLISKNEEEMIKIKQTLLNKIEEMRNKFEFTFKQFIDFQKQKAVQENKETQTIVKNIVKFDKKSTQITNKVNYTISIEDNNNNPYYSKNFLPSKIKHKNLSTEYKHKNMINETRLFELKSPPKKESDYSHHQNIKPPLPKINSSNIKTINVHNLSSYFFQPLKLSLENLSIKS